MKIFVISLDSDCERRVNLSLKFLKYYGLFHIVDACDIKYVEFLGNKINVREEKILITKVEVACALSHIKIYKKMIDENIQSCLILEDDVIGSDYDISKIINIYKMLPSNSILLAGGMDGMKVTKYLYGKETIENVYSVDSLYYKFLVRACCYVITLDIAKKILNMQERNLIRADEWGEFLKYEKNVFVASIFHHPLDLGKSHIEQSRRNELDGYLNRLIKEGIFFTVWKIIQRVGLKLLAKFKGLDLIFK